jgi:hypothetical protein
LSNGKSRAACAAGSQKPPVDRADALKRVALPASGRTSAGVGGVHHPYAWLALLGSITGGIAVGLLTTRIEKKRTPD